MAEIRFTYTMYPNVVLFDRVMHSRWGYISDMSDVLSGVADEIYEANKRQFLSEGVEALGSRWAKLSPRYAKAKAKRYPGKTILRRTDLLFHSLTLKADANAIHELTRDSLTIGTRAWYFRFHQTGTRYMPARTQGLSDKVRKAVIKRFHRGLWNKGKQAAEQQPSIFNIWTPESGSILNPGGQGGLF